MDENKSLEEQNLAQLAAAFNDHQITDEEGKLVEEPTFEDTATQEPNTEEETVKAQEPQAEEALSTQDEEEDVEIPAVDESGKRYIPEKRLKKETAKRREAERRAQALQELLLQTKPVRQEEAVSEKSQSDPNLDRLELKMVFKEYPQFNPESEEYNQDLDLLAGNFRRADKRLSITEAAEKAIETVKRLTSDQIKVAREARTVKAQQSDQGITSRVVNRVPKEVDFNKMSIEEKEAYLRETGQW